MSKITERISSLVKQQLPEFIRSDYTTFVSFIEAYYRFLEQDQNAQELIQNALKYSDIDRTASSFIQYFLKNYGSLIPVSVLANKPLLIKRLNDLYSAKGSELSFKLLFQILFNSDVSVKKPYDFVLRASDGNWSQPVSLRVRIVSGSIDDVLNRNLKLVKNGVTYSASVYRIKNLSAGLYELFLKARVLPDYVINDEVFVEDSNGVIFIGTVDPTTTSYNIINGGTGFKAGQIFTINIAGAVETVIQIKSVSSTGAITELKFINYGYGFTSSNLSVNLYKDLTVAARTVTSRTKTNSISDDFEAILVYTGAEPGRYFLEDYVEIGYTGDVLTTVSNDPGILGGTTFSTEVAAGVATIIFYMGALGRYPGQFITNNGFLSEPDIRLQDDKLYQPFAYQLESDIDISSFFDIVKSLVHPAGTNLFNNRTITAETSVKANVSLISSSNVSTELYSAFELIDSKVLTVTKAVSDSSLPTEAKIWSFYKPVTDSTLGFSDNNLINFGKTVSDITDQIQETLLINSQPVFSDSAELAESISKSVGTTINNTESAPSETISVFQYVESYAEPGYFGELYAAEVVQLI